MVIAGASATCQECFECVELFATRRFLFLGLHREREREREEQQKRQEKKTTIRAKFWLVCKPVGVFFILQRKQNKTKQQQKQGEEERVKEQPLWPCQSVPCPSPPHPTPSTQPHHPLLSPVVPPGYSASSHTPSLSFVNQWFVFGSG